MTKKPPPTMEDEEQSRRFMGAAKKIEADGGLSPTDAEEAFDGLLTRTLPERHRSPKPPE
jgi:hypothetical protein